MAWEWLTTRLERDAVKKRNLISMHSETEFAAFKVMFLSHNQLVKITLKQRLFQLKRSKSTTSNAQLSGWYIKPAGA